MHAQGWCGGHGKQISDGRPLVPLRERTSPGGDCSVADCDRDAVHDGLCYTHYDRKRTTQPGWDRPIREKGADGNGWISNGYKMIYRDGVRRGDHLWIAEKLLGHALRDGENVHHKNGNRADNRTDGPFELTPEGKLLSGNLEVWSTKQPAGQEIGPKLDWAFELIGDYLPY
jgi:hypothetical protein